MKNKILLALLLMWVVNGTSQIDEVQTENFNLQKTPELISLYEQTRVLEATNASAEEINANRLAIKNAWMEINPEVGNLYKPVETNGKLPEILENVHINGLHSTGDEGERVYENNTQNRWSTDVLIASGFVDGGVDVVVNDSGDIYASKYISFGADHAIFIYKSTDEGDTWTLYDEVTITAPILQLQLISLHGTGTGDDYLLAYFLTDSQTFQALRWNTTTDGAFEAEVMATDVTGFSVDRNYPVSTDSQRVFGVYRDVTSSNIVRSARSTAGSHGFDWVDESGTLMGVDQIDFTYGLNGSTYYVGVGNTSGNLRVNINPNYNDPATWEPLSDYTLEDGGDIETLNPTIIAGREALATDNVLVFASSRIAGSTDEFDGMYYRRTNGGAFSPGTSFGSGPGASILHPDSYIRLSGSTARLSYVREVDGSNNQNRSLTYNGTDFDPFEGVSDSSTDVFTGFKSATAELDSTNEPILVFSDGGNSSFGSNLYFDKESAVLNTAEFDLSSILVYPNPVTDNLIISSPQRTIDQVMVYNYLGQLVLTTEPNVLETEIDMNNLNKGLYLVQISAEGNLETHKVIKE